MRWPERESSYVAVSASDQQRQGLSTEQLGNVTDAHRSLIKRVPHGVDAAWSQRALWACVERLAVSTLTAANEVRVEQAWTDGPDAFCVVYAPPWSPNWRVGIRRHRDDAHSDVYTLGVMGPGYEPGLEDNPPNPEAFGHTVAEFDIGEPLGNTYSILRTDENAISWWGALNPVLPTLPERPAPPE